MTANPTLDMTYVNTALSRRLPQFPGPWTGQKTQFGQSNPTFILKGKNKKLVLRKKPKGELLRSAHLIEREYKVMKALSTTTVPVPKMFYLCDTPDEIGSVYFIMEFVDGITFSQPHLPKLDPEQRQKLYNSMISGLAKLHQVLPASIKLENFGKIGNYFHRQFYRWAKQYEATTTELILEIEILKDWLVNNLPKEGGASRIVHGDWRIDNLIFSKDNLDLLAIVDWELSTIGDPLADLAAQLMQWKMPVGGEGRGLAGINRKLLGIPTDQEYIEMYSHLIDLNDFKNLDFAIAFCFFRMAAILQGVKKRALDGNASNPEKAIKMGEYVSVYARKALDYLRI